jgi:hypothetical protein
LAASYKGDSSSLSHTTTEEMNGIAKGNFEFPNIRNGTAVVTKEMADFQFVK